MPRTTRLAPWMPPLAGWRPGAGLVRGVLLVFLLALGVAMAAPVVQPQVVELVCSGGGLVKAVVHTEDGVHALGAVHLDCPLCVTGGAPPSPAALSQAMAQPPGPAARSIPAARIAASAAPLPARGPPARS